jgi:hypothetical protein
MLHHYVKSLFIGRVITPFKGLDSSGMKGFERRSQTPFTMLGTRRANGTAHLAHLSCFGVPVLASEKR